MARDNRRRLRNYLLRPHPRYRYALGFFLLTSIGAGFVQLISYLTVSRVIERVLGEAGESAAALGPVVDTAVRAELLRTTWMLPLIGIATLTLAAIVLRRFIVPLVPIRRHIRKLVEGDYDARLQLRANDEVRDVADDLNELSETLQIRHAETSHKSPRIARAAGFSLVELLVVMAVVMILAMLGVAQFITAYDRSRQRATLADMRTIAAANGTYHVDKGDYATSFEELTPYYLGVLPPIDRWGFAWTYEHSNSSYTLTSPGSDGASGPAAPAGWNGDPFECDLVVWNGAFTQAPTTN